MPTSTHDLAVRVAHALAGDRAAIEALVRELEDDVYGLALRMLGERTAAEDATQEILLQVLTHLSQWRQEAPEPSSHFLSAGRGPNCAKNQLMYGWSLTI